MKNSRDIKKCHHLKKLRPIIKGLIKQHQTWLSRTTPTPQKTTKPYKPVNQVPHPYILVVFGFLGAFAKPPHPQKHTITNAQVVTNLSTLQKKNKPTPTPPNQI